MVKNENYSYNLEVSENEYLEKKESMTSFFLDKNYTPLTFKQIAVLLNVKKDKRELLKIIIEDLQDECVIIEDDSKRYVPYSKSKLFKGIYESKSEKFGFAILENGEDIFIEAKNSMGAYSGDEVLIKITEYSNSNGKCKEGVVKKIIKRNTTHIIGKFVKSRNFGFVEPLDKKTGHIYISKKNAEGYKDGIIVKVKITKYATLSSKAEGIIEDIIGNIGEDKSFVKALYEEYGLDKEELFNNMVQKELENIPSSIDGERLENRRDRTDRKVFTIDSDDAMDLDDGVSIIKNDDGTYTLSVYIADVSYYVKDGTSLDKEASTRGTSIYVPGTVIPMLPPKLSNGICSLNAGVKRLALAIDMIIDENGNVLKDDIFKAVIKVSKKMSYDKVYKVLTRSDEDVLKEYSEYITDLDTMKELALILNKKRCDSGSINFDIPETKVELDDEGNVLNINPYEITIANKLIEEFMLIANMVIAKRFYFLNLPFIYRVHEKPDDEKLRDLNEILSNYHKRIKISKKIQPKVLSNLLNEIEDEEAKKIVSTFMLRSLKVAKYSEVCQEHFGLAAKYYCHFTSPIRRYPDLFIHRVISDYINSNGVIPEERILKYTKQAQKYAYSSSEAEKNATKIEREFDNLYKVLYMKKYIGNMYEGRISSITSFGMFVELENTVEGFVPFELMPGNEYYEFNEKNHTLIGSKSSRIFRIGDKVKIKLVRCDLSLKQIDFEIIK